ncbi:MAG: flagellar protein FliS [Lachnospiraceae bacterium]|nr:flagellar protein FliS [Lachnospiraceae bacterium]
MTNEKVKEYTLRITNANRSELIVILCDLLLSYNKEAVENLEKGDMDAFKNAMMHAKGCVRQLIGALNRTYDLAAALYELYRYAERQLSLAQIRQDLEPIAIVDKIFVKLKAAFEEMAKQDNSGAVMQNTQSVYAGMTYGRNQLNESMTSEANRGFFA